MTIAVVTESLLPGKYRKTGREIGRRAKDLFRRTPPGPRGGRFRPDSAVRTRACGGGQRGNRREEATRQINEILSSLHEHKDPTNEIGADSLLVRIELEEGDIAAATRAIAAARSLLRQSQGREEHFLYEIANARVEAALGRLDEAQQSLKTIIAETTKHSNVRYELEARLALCEVEAKTDPVTAHADAKTLEQEAKSKGFGLIARKALAIRA